MYIRIYWKVLIWVVIMLVVFLAPSNSLPEGPELPYLDKIAHVFLFAVFAVLLLLARMQHIEKSLLVLGYSVLIIAFILGALIEFSQSLMDIGREGSLLDLLADLVGSLLGYFFVIILKKKRFSI